jgi:YD repeat-containing protein
MKRVTLILLLSATTLLAIAQDDPMQLKLPDILPPSPEAAAINKNGQLSVGMMSGGAQASIPLYEIKLKSVSIPISLNYASNGTKVDEIPSRAGMNWTLSPAGVVSRIVHGLPDDQTTRVLPPAGFPSYTPALFPYLDNISGAYSNSPGQYETEPDEFRFTAPGLSGKFILNNNGIPIEVPYSNLKIQVVGGPWGGGGKFSEIIITNTNGVKYRFGGTGAYEHTLNIQNIKNLSGISQIRTAFFLKKIELPGGDYIDFTYSPISFTSTTGKNYRVSDRTTSSFCTGCPDGQYSESVSSVIYQSVYLTGLSTSNYQYAYFSYEGRDDNIDDKKLKSISVIAGSFSRTFTLKYFTPDLLISSGYNSTVYDYSKRIFLKEVYYILSNSDTVTSDTLRYSLDYHNPDQLSPRLSTSQDHYGYYNGINNYTLLPPYPDLVFGSTYCTADRSSNSSAQNGMLKKLTFPTGGYEELEYEPNSISNTIAASTTAVKNVSGSGNNTSGGAAFDVVFYTSSFTILRDQNANLTFNIYANPGCTSCTPPPPNTVDIAKIEIQNLTDNTTDYVEVQRIYTYTTSNPPLLANKTYRLKMTVNGLANAAFGEIRYDYAATTQYAIVNSNTPGIRVKTIISYDPVSAKTTRKYYKYCFLDNLNATSGVYVFNQKYVSDNVFLYNNGNCQPGNTAPIICTGKVISSSSNNTLYFFDGLPWAYNSVIESDDPDFKNGGIEHNFLAVADNIEPDVSWGHTIIGLPANITTFLNGCEYRTRYFNKNKTILKESRNYYHIDNSVNNVYTAVTAREKVDYHAMPYNLNDPLAASYVSNMYDVNSYTYKSNWIQQDSTVTIDYDLSGAALKTKQVLYYGSPSNIQPIKNETYTSTGDVLTTEMKYPTDYVVAPYTNMISRNIISPVLETKQKRNTTDINLVRNNYKEWYNTSAGYIAGPETIVTKKGSYAEETRVHYYAYDNSGNPLEVAKENGERISYIWDYNKNLPVTEIKNAGVTTDSIAYTSFEADGKGYWQFSGAPISEAFQPTGYYCYNLNSGNIIRPVSSSKSYYVTYWLKEGSGSVSVNGTTAKLLIGRNGWICYQHTIQGSSLITVSGTGKIDELRLYPIGSYMTTFTHRTFVGINSRNEPNNQISYYEYDAAGRLILVRNMDRHIVRQFDYQYKKQIYPCSNTTANWIMTGALRCVKNNSQNNNNTGVQEREERDMNNCSATYLQTRWTSIGVTGQCPPVPNCSGPDKRVVNGVCETGMKILVSSLQVGNTQWQCTYHYVWTDGYVGADFIETGSTLCAVE